MKRRMFFFASYEGTRSRSPVNRLRTIPDPSIRGGNFAGLPAVVRDPLSGNPFPNNTIPANRVDPAAAAFLKLFPTPTCREPEPRLRHPYRQLAPGGQPERPQQQYRLAPDYNPADKDKFFFTFSRSQQGPRDEWSFRALNTTNGPRDRWLKRATWDIRVLQRQRDQ
jgi:hypothetical protein